MVTHGSNFKYKIPITMPPKKRIKITGQRTISSLFGTPAAAEDVNNIKADHPPSTEGETSTQTNDNKSNVRSFQQKWLKLWPWLKYEEGKMFCTECLKNGRVNSFTTGCETFKTSSMVRHEATTDHQSNKETTLLQAGMKTAVENSKIEEDRAVIKCLKVVYWLASENLPLSKYESLMKLLKRLDVPELDCLQIGKRIDYESYYSANEMLEAISDDIDEEITEKLKLSPCVTVFADESTDISNTKRMTMTARYVDPKTSLPSSSYLRDIEYEDGTGAGLASEIINEMEYRNINFSKITGFGADGASVMSGAHKGVQAVLKNRNPHMVHMHCMAHRLALCTSQAANGIPAIKQYQEWITSLYYYFKKSACREAELHKVQEVLQSPTLRYKEIHEVRWLSFYEPLEAVYRTLDALITYFNSRDAPKDPKAKGLLKKLATTKFFYITYMLMDTMSIVTRLCLAFQAEDLDVAKAKVSKLLFSIMTNKL